MTYTGTTINQSPTITLVAGEDIIKAQGKAVIIKDGKAVTPTAGANAVGVILLDAEETIKKDNDVTIQIKDIGAWVAGEAIAAGDELATDEQGYAVKAQSGNFIIGIALTTAEKSGTVIRAQIIKAGYK